MKLLVSSVSPTYFRPRLTCHAVCAGLLTGLCCAAAPAQAAIVQTNAFNNTAAGLPVSSTDLLQTDLASASAVGVSSFGGTPDPAAILANGTLGNIGAIFDTENAAPGNGATITFNLNTATNPLGYEITSLTTFASWDTGRDGQQYTVAFSTVGAPATFTDLFTITLFDSPQANFNPATTSVTVTEDAGAGVLATGVASLRYTFTSFENSGTAYREIDVVGSAVGAVTVPEAGTSVFAAIGAGAAAAVGGVRTRRRRLTA